MDAAKFIDLEAYPIGAPGTVPHEALLTRVRASLSRDGCAVIKRFLTPAGIRACVAEADAVADRAHRSMSRTNPYFSQDDPSLPEDHPKRRFYDRSNAFIPADNFAPEGPIRSVQNHPGFDDFIRTALGAPKGKFHRYADPLADVIVNTAAAGNGFPWHFDTNNFTVTLALQNAGAGGAFEYAADIRRGDENFDEVSRVLDETSDRVTVLNLEPGDLQLFKGRYSLHRVAPLSGTRARHVAIYSYVEEPGMVGSPERTRQLYGRVLPVHLERAGVRSDSYAD